MAITLNGSTGVTTTGLTSNGIDDNANSTAITIDSSENVLANTTSTSVIGNGGFAIKPQTGNGTRVDISNAGQAMLLDGAASGPIIGLYGNGTSVGSIGTGGGRPYFVADNGSNGGGFKVDSTQFYPVDRTGAVSNGVLNLGYSSGRWKDLYLSGGVYLGGTGSANKLDDYEEGTWTPTYTSSSTDPTFSPSLQNGVYTKIGRMVYASFRLRGAISGTKTGNLRLSGLPFTANSSPANGSGGVGLTENFGADNYPTNLRVNQSATYINLMVYDNADPRDGLFTNVTVTSTSGSSSGNYIIGHVVYQTD